MSHSRFPGFRAALNGGAATMVVGVALIANVAFAQEKPQTPQVVEQSKPANSDEIVVTGSRIRNPNLALSTPVNVTTSDEINLRQTNLAEDLLREIPGITPNVGDAVNNGNGGASFVDLRGLGPTRNLVLIDGGRIVPAGLIGAVDLNNIPLALIDRVDVLTGGASTTYGADAVSGVVNFVLRKNFTGIEANVNQQISERGDAHRERYDLTVGGNFADGKGNAVLSVGYLKNDPLYQSDRGISVAAIDSFSGAVAGSGTTIPARFTLGSRTRQINPATGALQPGAVPFNFNPYNLFQTPFNRYNIFGEANYRASDAVEVYTRGLFSKNSVETVVAPSGAFSNSVLIPLSNPYLPARARNQFCASTNAAFNGAGDQVNLVPDPANPGQFINAPLSQAQCDRAAVATRPGNPDYLTTQTTVRRRTPETGVRTSLFTTQVFDYRAGVRGALGEHLHYDVFGDYGQSENTQQQGGYVSTSRLRQALLATNPTTCLNNTNGCVPVNFFGPLGSITPAQTAFLTENAFNTIKTSLLQVGGQLNGDLGFHSPLATTAINFAVGAEYREYRATQTADNASATPGELGGAGAAITPFSGGYNVVEGFGELAIPLIEDRPFIKSLTFQTGIRYSSYTVDAPGSPHYNTTTYKGGGSYEPVRGLKLRGNYERAVRAPNLGELFTPQFVGLTNLTNDPCQQAQTTGTANLTAVCLAQGAPAASIGNIQAPSASQANTTSGGNPNLNPEKSDTFTVGAIFQPNFVHGFSLSLDYYHIVINGAVTVPTPNDVLTACFGANPLNVAASQATNPVCTSTHRNPVTGALDGDPATTGGIFQGFTNQGRIFTRGLDLAADYHREIGPFKLGLNFTGNYVFEAKFKSNSADPASLNRECSGFYSTNCDAITGSLQPKYQWSQRTTIGYEAVDLSLLWRHIGGFNQEPDDIANGNGPACGVGGPAGNDCGNGQQFSHISPYDYFDLSMRVAVMNNLTFTVSVLNLTDNGPPNVGYNIGATVFNSGNTFPSTYDAVGRRYAATLRMRY